MPRVAVFDVESTGIDVETDKIVTAFLGTMDSGGNWVDQHSWLLNPGVPIPEEASAVHGITTEQARVHGANHYQGVEEIATAIRELPEIPLVIYNAPFDTTILDRNLRFHRLPSVNFGTVVDPYVIDKALDPYRKGLRKLVNVAQHYGIEVDESKAHDASYDCLLAGRIALRMRPLLRQKWNQGSDFWPWLMDFQRKAKAEQSASFQKYLREKKGEKDIVIDPSWPIRPFENKENK